MKIRLAVVASHSHICKIKSLIDCGANRKRICNVLLVICNFENISYCFRDIDGLFSHPSIV